jgi:hypothetical protein
LLYLTGSTVTYIYHCPCIGSDSRVSYCIYCPAAAKVTELTGRLPQQHATNLSEVNE